MSGESDTRSLQDFKFESFWELGFELHFIEWPKPYVLELSIGPSLTTLKMHTT